MQSLIIIYNSQPTCQELSETPVLIAFVQLFSALSIVLGINRCFRRNIAVVVFTRRLGWFFVFWKIVKLRIS